MNLIKKPIKVIWNINSFKIILLVLSVTQSKKSNKIATFSFKLISYVMQLIF